jgi:xanthine/CO dehydrogenase XdhC/CoxF family maturation factor
MQRRAESLAVFAALERTLAAGEPGAIATVAAVVGSAYRRPGARMLVAGDGSTMGGISGGCLDEDVRLRAIEGLRGRSILRVEYDTSDTSEVGLGLGCGGLIELFIRPFGPEELEQVSAAREALSGPDTVGIAWRLEGSDQGEWAAGRRSEIHGPGSTTARAVLDAAFRNGGDRPAAYSEGPWFIELLPPSPRLLVCGGGDDSLPLVELAARAGFDVVVLDHRPSYLDPGRFPIGVRPVRCRPGESHGPPDEEREELVVVKTHSYEADRAWLEYFLDSRVSYIGLMGSKDRVSRLRAVAGSDTRVYGPTGLDIGGRGPEQIALSIVAELLAIRAGRSAGHLRDRSRPIHER